MSFLNSVKQKYGDPVRDDGQPTATVHQILTLDGATPYALAALNRECAKVTTAPAREYAGTITPYAAKALQAEIDTLAATTEGGRDNQINKSTFALAQLVAGGELPGQLVFDEIRKAALSTGQPEADVQRAMRSGYTAGVKEPRQAPPPTPSFEAPTATTIQGDEPEEPDVASWAPLDLTAYVDGTYKPILPTVMERKDGNYLLYPGMTHSFQGESESGKSMIAQAETARQISNGHLCLYIDFESDASTVIPRLLMLGATPRDIKERLHYIRPDITPYAYPIEREAWQQLLSTRYTLVIIDGVTEAFSVYGVKSVDNDEVTTWGRAVPRTIAAKTGAAVVVIDHVTKTTEGRGRFAIGAQAKMSYLTGASYMVEVISPIGVGMTGELALRVGKDRPGMVRPISGEWRKSDRTQETAVITIDSTTPGVIAYSVGKPGDVTVISGDTETDEKVLQFIRDAAPRRPSLGDLEKGVYGGRGKILEARARLAQTGLIAVDAGPANAQLHRLLDPITTPSEGQTGSILTEATEALTPSGLGRGENP